MTMILRLGRNIAKGAHCKPVNTPATALNPIKFNGISRHLTQPAMKEDEEVEIDQRRLPTNYDPATFDPTEHQSPPTDRVFRLVDEVTGLTMAEVAQLGVLVKTKLKMKEQHCFMKPGAVGLAAMDMKATPAAAAKQEKKPEKTVFKLKLESIEAANKLKVVKEVRSFTTLNLKDAKDAVEKLPSVIKTGVTSEEGQNFIKIMETLGAKAVLE